MYPLSSGVGTLAPQLAVLLVGKLLNLEEVEAGWRKYVAGDGAGGFIFWPTSKSFLVSQNPYVMLSVGFSPAPASYYAILTIMDVTSGARR